MQNNDLISRKALIEDLMNLEVVGGHKMYRKGCDHTLHGLVPEMINAQPAVDALVLPCKIGDTVWTIIYDEIPEAKVTCIRPFVFEDFVEFRGNAVITMADPFYSDGRPLTQELFIIFGKDTFLTREEAEAALAERKMKDA